MSNAIAFIDANVTDYQTLLANLTNSVEVHILNNQEDGLLQIASLLQGRTNLDAIHIISHGNSGALLLGSAVLNNADINNYKTVLQQIGSSLNANGDMLLYGCNVAQGQNGQQFIEQLAQWTSADIAASTNLTGASDLGGDWVLEAQTGIVEASTLATNFYTSVLAPAIGGLSNISYTENGLAKLVSNGITLSGGGGYGNGYIEFKITGNADNTDNLAVLNSTSPTDAGAISILGVNVYYGTGSDTIQIGTIDRTYNGAGGNALRINLSALVVAGTPITNGDFSDGLTGWNAVNDRVDLGNDLPGTSIPTPPDSAVFYPYGSNNGDSGSLSTGNPWTVDASSGALIVENTSMTVDPYGVVHGPAAYSDPFYAVAGKTLAFNWQADNVNDDYHVVGYLVDSSNNIIMALSSTGTTGSGMAGATIPKTDNYRFVFISGTYDASGGQAAGASMIIDNIVVGDPFVVDAVVSDLAKQITYSSTSDNPVASKTVTVSAVNGVAETTSGTFDINITAENDAPAIGSSTNFQILSLTANNYQATDVDSTVGDDRGGIAITPTRVFLTGDDQTASFDAATLNNATGTGVKYDGLVQNIATGKLYSLSTDGTTPANGGGTFTHLLGIDDITGALDGTSVVLSTPITTYDYSGIFSGYNRAAILSDTGTVYDINFATGEVTTAGSITAPSEIMRYSENWAGWGVAEYFNNQLFLAYRSGSSDEINRINVSTGAIETIATFSDLGDLASFTVSPSTNKWYYHYESSGQLGDYSETLGYADATFSTAGTFNIDIADNTTATPFSTVTVADPDTLNVSIAITYTAANGTLAGTGLTGTAGNYTLTSDTLATVQSELRALVFTPTENQVATGSTVQTTFTLTPNDGVTDGAANTSVVVTTTSINDAPVISSGATVNAAENQTAVTTITSTDVESNTVTYSVSGGADASKFSVDTNSGVLTFVNAPNFESPTDANADNVYDVTITATDNGTPNASSTQDMAVTVTNVNDAPTVSNNVAVAMLANDSVVIASSKLQVIDEEQSAGQLIYTITTAPTNGVLKNGTATLSVGSTFTQADINDNSLNFTAGTSNDSFKFTVADGNGGSVDETTFSISVNNAPTITGNATPQAAENQTAVTTISSTDVESNNITYSLTGADATKFDIGSNGALTFKTAPNFESPTDDGTDNVYDVTVTATDNGTPNASKTQNISVTVTNANDAATGSVTISDTAPYKDEVLTVTNNLVDQDGISGLTYKWFVGTTEVGSGNTYTVTANDVGQTIKVTATYTDGFDSSTVNVDSVATSVVTNDANLGGDTSTHTVPRNDTLTGISGNDTISGYTLNDVLSGNAGNDKIYGGTGQDTLDGGIGDDLLNGDNGYDNIIGGDGDDMLDGGADTDTLDGGNGNDTYQVSYYDTDLIKDSGNNSSETDSVNIPFQVTKYTLSSGIENGIIVDSNFKTNSAFGLANASRDTVTGNAKNNELTGNNGSNVLNGDLGNDILNGNAGNDNLNGGSGTDNLDGGVGNDNLNGGAGNDILYGGVGSDTFIFTDYLSNNVDSIGDFSVIDDTIQLENAIFTKLTMTGTLNNTNFKIGVNAADNNDYVIYNKTSGVLLYDADGNGAGISLQIAIVGTNLALTTNDFIVS